MGYSLGIQYLSLSCHLLLLGAVLYRFDFNSSCVTELFRVIPKAYSTEVMESSGTVVLQWVVVIRYSPDEYLLGGNLPGWS